MKINYAKEEFLDIIKKVTKLTEATFNKFKVISPEHQVRFIAIFFSYIFTMLPGLKHHGYKLEEEFRLYTSELDVNGKKYPYPIPEKNKFVRPIPPIKLKYPTGIPTVKSDPFDHADICEIWVGPSLDYEDANAKVEEILKDAGYCVNKVKIIKSKVPYRSY